MTRATPPVALLYDDSAYVETLKIAREQVGETPIGLFGRQVAGREFLEAYLNCGEFSELIAITWNRASADSLAALCKQHPRAGRFTPRIIDVDRFLDRGGAPAAPILYYPCPPAASFAWMRYERGPDSYAISGVTHTLCSAGMAELLCDFVTAPYEPYDALICTSSAVVRMVRTVTGAYADYLRDRFGGTPTLRPRLEQIPLGVNAERFRPATAGERSARRAQLNIRPEAVAVLFVGRFAPHAKAHPFPMYQGLARAARSTGQPVHLVMSGWAPNDDQLRIYLEGLAEFAPGIPVSVVNGVDPDLRFGVWHAADIFTSLSDSIQETFGLVVIEAMASGLPVVATDWDGYRDLVVDGETGILVPTCMVRDATADTTLRLLLGSLDYDAFLAECNQTVAVDVDAVTSAYARLLVDPALRQRLGRAGRARVEQHFTWEHVVKAYEQLWGSQDAERRAHVASGAAPRRMLGPPCYPAPEVSFAGYPSMLLGADDRVATAPGALDELGRVLKLFLCTYASQRVTDEAVLHTLLHEAAAPRRLSELVMLLEQRGIRPTPARATLAWLLKYGLLTRA